MQFEDSKNIFVIVTWLKVLYPKKKSLHIYPFILWPWDKWITNTDIIHSSTFMHHLSPSPSSKVHPVKDNEFFFIKKKSSKIFIFWKLVYYTFSTLPNTQSNHLQWSEKPNVKYFILYYFENNFGLLGRYINQSNQLQTKEKQFLIFFIKEISNLKLVGTWTHPQSMNSSSNQVHTRSSPWKRKTIKHLIY